MTFYIKGVDNFSLFAHRCPCGEMNIHGFWHQLKPQIDHERRLATVIMPCSKCNRIRKRIFRLTMGNPLRHRLLRWDRLFWWLCDKLPYWMLRPLPAWVLWLERKVPL